MGARPSRFSIAQKSGRSGLEISVCPCSARSIRIVDGTRHFSRWFSSSFSCSLCTVASFHRAYRLYSTVAFPARRCVYVAVDSLRVSMHFLVEYYSEQIYQRSSLFVDGMLILRDHVRVNSRWWNGLLREVQAHDDHLTSSIDWRLFHVYHSVA